MAKALTGIYLCHCGTNIASTVRIRELGSRLEALAGVALVRDYPYMCSDPGQEMIRRDLREGLVRRVLVAACSPALHERTFRRVLESEGLNPYLYEHVNIRENCSWVHSDPEQATRKAYELIRAGLLRLRRLRPLSPASFPVTPRVLVLGGGLAGVTAALDVLEAGFEVVLVEREEELGGWALRLGRGFPSLEPLEGFLRGRVEALREHPGLKLYLRSRLTGLEGFAGNFRARIEGPHGEATEEVGSVIVAVGFRPFDARRKPEYGYGRLQGVITTVEFEEMLQDGGLPEPEGVAFVHCVGSRDQTVGHEYCSRACCMVVAKQALLLKQRRPETKVYVLYMDVRAFGKGYEEFYERVQRAGVIYLRGNPGEVFERAGRLCLRYEDTLLGRPRELEVDLVVLAVGMEPPEGVEGLAKVLGVPLDRDGFFLEAHPKLGPLDTYTEGVFLAGCCQGPKDIPDTVAQGAAAAAAALSLMDKGKVVLEPVRAKIDEEKCCGCKLCIANCPYQAIDFDEEKKVSVVHPELCKGCGTCVAGCPSGAAAQENFEDVQIFAEIEGALAE